MKIKYANIQKLNKLSAREMDLYFYLVKHMDQSTGRVEGVYYRDVIKHTGMCKQSFYNALKGLEDKGTIAVQKLSEIDYDVRILDNDFPDEAARSKGYVKLNRKAFHSREFNALKAHEKYMLLEFLKGTHENKRSIKIGMEELYEKFKRLLRVSMRVIRGYLHSLKKFFYIGIKDGMYYITYRADLFKSMPRGGRNLTEAEQNWGHLVEKECWRNRILYDETSLRDTMGLVRQYRQYGTGKEKDMLRLLMQSIRTSIEDVEQKKRRLQAKYIHNLVRKGLGLAKIH